MMYLLLRKYMGLFLIDNHFVDNTYFKNGNAKTQNITGDYALNIEYRDESCPR